MTIMGGTTLVQKIPKIAQEIVELKKYTTDWNTEKEACNKIDAIASCLKSELKANGDLKALAPGVAADLAKCNGATPVRNAKKLKDKVERLQSYTGKLIRVFVKHAETIQCGTKLNAPAKALQQLTQKALNSHMAFLSSEKNKD